MDELLNVEALWQMSQAEKASILYLLDRLPQTQTAIEVGTYKGGFVRVLAKRFKTVFSLDLDHSNVVGKLDFPNVVWVQGDSRVTLPAVLAELAGQSIDVILIDGDHRYDAVLSDINHVLRHVPVSPLLLLMHDSWYTETRDAINWANWNQSPHVQWVEKDFVVGDLVGEPQRSFFVGGLALAYLTPWARVGDVEIRQSHDYMYRTCLKGLGKRLS